MRKMLDGSKVARGRKKRRMLSPMTPVKEAMTPQTIRRRNLLTGGSGAVCTRGPGAGGRVATAFDTPALMAGVGVEVVFDAPEAGATRAAGGVAAGKDFPGASPVGAASPTVPEEARRAAG